MLWLIILFLLPPRGEEEMEKRRFCFTSTVAVARGENVWRINRWKIHCIALIASQIDMMETVEPVVGRQL